MSDHAWALENLASHVAGGLDAAERDRLEEHVAGCPDCARALDEARAVDRRLEALFADVRPNPALEDRSIRALRQASGRAGPRKLSRSARVMLSAAAVLFLALVGMGMTKLMEAGNLLFPGAATSNEKQIYADRSYFGVKERSDQLGTDWPDTESAKRRSVGTPRDADGLAEELRDRIDSTATFNGVLMGDGSTKAITFLDRSGSMPDPLTTTEIDPAAIAQGLDINYNVQRKAEVAVPGIVNHDESVGIENGDKKVPPVNRPLPPGKRQGYFRPGDAFQKTPPKKESRLHFKSDSPLFGPKGGVDATEFERHRGEEVGGRKAGDGEDKGKKAKNPGQEHPPAPTGRKIIRSGNMDFEVDSFDAAVATITRLIGATKGGFIATINSDKLANGKVRGSVVVRVPPDQLDRLLLDLRKELGKTGELKGQRIGSEDITKKYIDFESELRSNRAMEERLLKIIRDGKGTIKDLVVAEEALGKYRTQIERLEGELRYYANLVSLSTLTVNLTEKEIRVAAALTERERVQAGIEVEDVDTALREALTAVTEARGRIRKSELKQLKDGQYSAELEFEAAPEKAGPLRDRLRQIGRMARLEINRVLHAEGGVLALKDGKIQPGPTQFSVNFYNLANVEPRETLTLKIAAPDVPAAFRKLRAALAGAEAHVKDLKLNEQDQQNITARLDFDVRRAKEGALQTALAEAGAVLTRQLSRSPASENVTDAKVGYKVELVPTTAIPPRELMTLALVVNDVDATMTLFQAQVKEAHGRAGDPIFTREADGRVTARRIFIVPLTAAQGLFEHFKSAGQVRVEQVKENAQAPEGKLAVARIDVTLSNTAQLVPADAGLWAQVRHGLSFSLRALFTSASWLVFGVLVVLPWLLVVLVCVWVVRRLMFGSTAATAPVTVTPVSGGTAATGG